MNVRRFGASVTMAAAFIGAAIWFATPVTDGDGPTPLGNAMSAEPARGPRGDEPTAPAALPAPAASGPAGAGATPSAPAPEPATRRAVAAPTYRTSGRFLLDPSGARVVVRGAEQVFWDAAWLSPSIVTEIGRSGANAVRIVPYYQRSTPTGEPPSTLAQIEQMIRNGIDAGMLVDVAIDGGKDPAVYLRPEIRTLLQRYERWIVIHAKGESYEPSDDAWATASVTAIRSLRAAGYQAPLYVMARSGGRNLPTLLHRGAAVANADPLHNVVFGWQAYWGSDLAYQSEYGLSLTDAMRRAAAAPFPIQVGLIHRSDPELGSPQTVPYQALMGLAEQLSLGWLWWDWRMGVDNLTSDGVYGHWAGPGLDVVVENAFSVARTSVRTAFQRAQSAP